MAKINSKDNMWPIKQKENRQLLIYWPNLISITDIGMRRYGSLINITPSSYVYLVSSSPY